MSRKPLVSLLCLCVLQGCAVGEGRVPPLADAPPLWKALETTPQGNAFIGLRGDDVVNQRWWQLFNDPALNGLITRALANNLDLKLAAARVDEARAARKSTQATLMPQLEATAGASRGNTTSSGNSRVTNTTEVGLEASWEVDLFGRNKQNLSAAGALLQSTEARRQAVQVALLAEVARHYFVWRNLERQLQITAENLTSQRRTLEVVKARFAQGDASDFDRQRAAAQVKATEALLPALKAAATAEEHRLSVLTGTLPGERLPGATPSCLATARPLSAPAPAPQVLLAAPAVVLANRPDLRAAERNLAAASASTEAERRAWLPAVNLLGMFGLRDNTAFAATPWSFAASLAQPVLNFGAIDARIEAASAREQQAYLSYRQTVLTAVEDMENALSGYIHEVARAQSLQEGYNHSAAALSLAEERFNAGEVDLLDTLVAQRDLLRAASDLAASQALMNQRLVAIYAATGGGWDLP